MFFDGLHDILRVFVMALLTYAGMVLILRISGKRTLGKFDAFDFVITVGLGSTLATIILTEDVTLLEGLVAVTMLVLLQYAVSRLSRASQRFHEAVRSTPVLLVDNGRYLEKALTAERVARHEIDAALRKAGIGRIDDVAAVVLETDGTLSVIRKSGRGEMNALRSVKRL